MPQTGTRPASRPRRRARQATAWAAALALSTVLLAAPTLAAPAPAAPGLPSPAAGAPLAPTTTTTGAPQTGGGPAAGSGPSVPGGPNVGGPQGGAPGVGGPGAPAPTAHSVMLAGPGTVAVKHLPPPPAGGPGLRPPIPGPLARHPRALAKLKRGPMPAPSTTAQVTTLMVAGAVYDSGGTTTGGSSTGSGPGLPLMSLNQQVAQFGSSETLVPPDTQLAAGPTDLMEVDNAVASIWTKSGTLVNSFDLNNFLGLPSEDLGMGAFDPRIAYDAASGRWFLSASATDPTNTYNQVFLAVSQTSDPSGGWNVYTVESNNYGELYDQPMFGVSGDKVVISWNDFGYGSFLGQETWVLQKSDLLTGAAVASVNFGPDSYRFRLVPALNLSAGNNAYLVYNNSDPTTLLQNTSYPSLGFVEITGQPANGNVRWLEWDPAIAPTSAPPGATQPDGAMAIDTDDDRFVSAVWQNGILWVAGNDACVPSGGSVTQSCLRLIEVSTAGGSPSILQDFDAGVAGTDLYYPAVSLDSSGNLFVAFSYSSASVYASVGATGQPAGAAAGTLDPIVTVEQGQGVYCGFDCSGGYGTNRWGDYSAAAQDPSNPSQVWVAGEYAASPTDQGDWGTAAEAMSASGS